jgi:hypothetical protein
MTKTGFASSYFERVSYTMGTNINHRTKIMTTYPRVVPKYSQVKKKKFFLLHILIHLFTVFT